MGKNPFKAAGFKNLRQVVAKVGKGLSKSPVVKAVGRNLTKAINAGGAAIAEKAGAPSMKKGGIVKKTGLHYLHKGERVIPVGKRKK